MSSVKRSNGDFAFDIFINVLFGIIIIVIVYPLYFVAIASVSDPVQVFERQCLFWRQRFPAGRVYANLRNGKYGGAMQTASATQFLVHL